MKKILSSKKPHKKSCIHVPLMKTALFVALAIFFSGIATATDAPELNVQARGGDCNACHKQDMLPENHPGTKDMKTNQCMDCHKQDSPELFHRLPLSHRHLIDGISCSNCHGNADPPAFVDKDTCMQCHTPEALVEATRDTHPANPHDSHYGPELDCDLCHHVHAPSENFCNQCHEFEFVVPSPITKEQ
jgi:hypothetical protein